MRRLAWLLALGGARAAADDNTTGIRLRATRWEAELEQQGPLLHLDYIPSNNLQGIGATVDAESHVLGLGRLRVSGQGQWWKSTLSPQGLGPDDFDEQSLGWRAAFAISYDLGIFQIGASVAQGHLDSRYARGTYRLSSVGAYRTFRLSRWMTAWISVGMGSLDWIVEPDGENDATFRGFTLGTTFR